MTLNNKIALGIDIGGTKISMACVSGGEIAGEPLSYKTLLLLKIFKPGFGRN